MIFEEKRMKRVTGIGGIVFKAKHAPALQAPYKRHLGVDVQIWGDASLQWVDADGKAVAGTTAWLINLQDSGHFTPSNDSFMVNDRMADLHALLKALRDEGCTMPDKVDEPEYFKFGWVVAPQGNKVELWEPPAGP